MARWDRKKQGRKKKGKSREGENVNNCNSVRDAGIISRLREVRLHVQFYAPTSEKRRVREGRKGKKRKKKEGLT